MALDIRLDFITKINPATIEEMSILRKKYIDIDNNLKEITDTLAAQEKPAGLRAAALARTHLETGLQYAIKSLCIIGENHV